MEKPAVRQVLLIFIYVCLCEHLFHNRKLIFEIKLETCAIGGNSSIISGYNPIAFPIKTRRARFIPTPLPLCFSSIVRRVRPVWSTS